jgi:hypothetical protein
MGKRSNFERVERDFYPTPREAVFPLLPHLSPATAFAEPCAGDGALIRILDSLGHACVWASDIEPKQDGIVPIDALLIPSIAADCIITNPPWDRKILHPMIEHLSSMLPTWLLFDADWPHTRQSAELIKRCSKIVAIGRVKWIPGSLHVGKDNCCWYLFEPRYTEGPRFYGRSTFPPTSTPEINT